MDWRFWRWAKQRRRAKWVRELDDQLAWERRMRAAGWRQWVSHPPPYVYTLLELSRREWPTISVCSPRDCDAAMNIAGLWWRPARDDDLAGVAILELDVERP
jgi:hypothetical protein